MVSNSSILKYDFLNRTCTSELKGISILLVILGHLKLIHFAGAWGVSTFLILSGFGLTRSYLKNGLDNFFMNKFKKIMIPYVLITIFWIIIDEFILGKKYAFFNILFSLLGLNFHTTIDLSMWYITFQLLWYCSFFIVFSLKISNFFRMLFLFFFSIFLLFCKDIFTPESGAILYVFQFPLGVILGIYYEKLERFGIKQLRISFLLLSILFFSIFTIVLNDIWHYSFYYGLANITFSIGLICIISFLTTYRLRLPLLLFIGSISFELYLLEYVFIWKYNIIFSLFSYVWFRKLLYFVTVFSLSILLGKLHKLITNYLPKRNSTHRKAMAN